MKPTSKLFICITFLLNGLYCDWIYAQSPSIKLLSYNVYFDDKSGKTRYPNIIHFMKKGQYDIILLQECTADFINRLSQDEVLKSYTLVKGDPAQGYTNVILTSRALYHSGDIPVTTQMGRSAPFLILQDDQTLVVDVHLESGLSDTASRKKQITQILKASQSTQNIVIAGDFNFGDGEPEEKLFSEFIDPGKTSKIITYDVDNNPIAIHTKYLFEKSRRLDKIYVKCESCNIFNYKVDKVSYSDHWPISIILSFNPSPLEDAKKQTVL